MKVRFYCENCGKEVPFNAEVCPYCGRIFEAVKCPICGYEGVPSEFSNGCPVCGYLSANMNLEVKKKRKGNPSRMNPDHSKIVAPVSVIGKMSNEKKRGGIKISPLLFRIVVVILLIILFFLIYLFFRV